MSDDLFKNYSFILRKMMKKETAAFLFLFIPVSKRIFSRSNSRSSLDMISSPTSIFHSYLMFFLLSRRNFLIENNFRSLCVQLIANFL